MIAAQAAENHGNEWGLTWYLKWRIYISVAPSLKIFFHGTSLKWSRRLPNHHKNSHKMCDKKGSSLLSLKEIQWKSRSARKGLRSLRAPNINFSCTVVMHLERNYSSPWFWGKNTFNNFYWLLIRKRNLLLFLWGFSKLFSKAITRHR